MRLTLAFALAAGLALPAFAADAPARHVLQTVPVSGAPAEQIVTAEVTFPAGSHLGYHTHPGEETGVVTSGALTVQIEGQAPHTYKAGEAFAIPRGTFHQASAEAETHLVGTYVVDKDKPLATAKP